MYFSLLFFFHLHPLTHSVHLLPACQPSHFNPLLLITSCSPQTSKFHTINHLSQCKKRKWSVPNRTMTLPFPKTSSIENLSNKEELAVSLGPLKLKLDQVQSRLNRCGLTSLIVKLITSTQHDTVMLETVKLAVALLKGGHREVQVRRGRRERERERAWTQYSDAWDCEVGCGITQRRTL